MNTPQTKTDRMQRTWMHTALPSMSPKFFFRERAPTHAQDTEAHRRTETCSLQVRASHTAAGCFSPRQWCLRWQCETTTLKGWYIFLHCHIHEISQLTYLSKNAPQLKVWILSSSRQVTLAAYVQSETAQKAWHPLSGTVWPRGKGAGWAVIQTMSWTVAPLLKTTITSNSAEGMRWFRSVA